MSIPSGRGSADGVDADTDRWVDAHVHHWALARGDYAWLTPDLTALYRDFGAEDYRSAGGAGSRILVQAAPTVAESRYLLSLAHADPAVVGVVGWVPLDDPDAVDELARDSRLRGIRPMIQDQPDTDWMLAERWTPGIEACADRDLVFELLIQPRHLDNTRILLDRHPDLRPVICHAAKPAIAEGAFDAWACGIAALARDTGAACKLSGLLTEAGPRATVADLRPYVEHLLEQFGPSRLIWGSDWPVVTVGGSYERWVEVTVGLLADLTAAERDAVLGGNARHTYRIA